MSKDSSFTFLFSHDIIAASSLTRHKEYTVKIEETIITDGLHIVSCSIPASKKVYLKIICGVGSAYDPPNQDGLFHYFEHMAFKGTEKRTVKDIDSFRKRNFLTWGAQTGQIMTTYYGKAVTRKLPQLCDLLCDIYFHSVFPAEEIEREKEVIQNEIARDNDDDSFAAHSALWKLLWQNNPLRKFGVGTPEGIQNISRSNLHIASEQWYTPSNTVILAAGNLHHNDVLNELAQYIPRKEHSRLSHQEWRDEYDEIPLEKKISLIRPEREKAIVLLGWKFPFTFNLHEKLVKTFLLYTIGTGTGSLLWKEIREKRGLAYTISAGISETYPLGSYFYIQIETLPKRIDQVCELAMELINKPLDLHCYPNFDELNEWFYDWYSLGHENDLDFCCDYLFDKINKKQNPREFLHYFPNALKKIPLIGLEEVEAMRQKTIHENHIVIVVVKPI